MRTAAAAAVAFSVSTIIVVVKLWKYPHSEITHTSKVPAGSLTGTCHVFHRNMHWLLRYTSDLLAPGALEQHMPQL
jgi:hypothetical protein